MDQIQILDQSSDPGHTIEDEAALRAFYPPARYLRILDRLDEGSRLFIHRSPLLIIGSADAESGIDLSPRGGSPGFVRVLNDYRLAIPDRAGNNRLDTMKNILANRQIGLFFLVPGTPETLRIKGEARLSTDPQLISGFTPRDRGNLAIVVTVHCAFIHCAKALNHAQIWSSATALT